MTNIQTEVIQYKTAGVCAQAIQIQVFDGIVQNVEFFGGCDGNHKGLVALVKGLTLDEVISKLSGIHCGDRDTSCPDQLAKALILYKNKRMEYQQAEPEQVNN